MDENLLYHERKIFSQNGEDGIIARIFELIGTTNRQYLEFGVGAGSECLSRNLQENLNFSGTRWDCTAENKAFNVFQEFVTIENIDNLCERYVIPTQLDFLGIDIDGNDWHIWKAMPLIPRVVVIEFNPSWIPPEDKVLPYDPSFKWEHTNRYGASIQAMYNLGRRLGYTLVYQESSSTNLFFVLDTALVKAGVCFKNQNDPARLYLRPNYACGGPNGGHVADKCNIYVTSESLL